MTALKLLRDYAQFLAMSIRALADLAFIVASLAIIFGFVLAPLLVGRFWLLKGIIEPGIVTLIAMLGSLAVWWAIAVIPVALIVLKYEEGD